MRRSDIPASKRLISGPKHIGQRGLNVRFGPQADIDWTIDIPHNLI